MFVNNKHHLETTPRHKRYGFAHLRLAAMQPNLSDLTAFERAKSMAKVREGA